MDDSKDVAFRKKFCVTKCSDFFMKPFDYIPVCDGPIRCDISMHNQGFYPAGWKNFKEPASDVSSEGPSKMKIMAFLRIGFAPFGI